MKKALFMLILTSFAFGNLWGAQQQQVQQGYENLEWREEAPEHAPAEHVRIYPYPVIHVRDVVDGLKRVERLQLLMRAAQEITSGGHDLYDDVVNHYWGIIKGLMGLGPNYLQNYLDNAPEASKVLRLICCLGLLKAAQAIGMPKNRISRLKASLLRLFELPALSANLADNDRSGTFYFIIRNQRSSTYAWGSKNKKGPLNILKRFPLEKNAYSLTAFLDGLIAKGEEKEEVRTEF